MEGRPGLRRELLPVVFARGDVVGGRGSGPSRCRPRCGRPSVNLVNLHRGLRPGRLRARYHRLRYAERPEEWDGPTHAELAAEVESQIVEREYRSERGLDQPRSTPEDRTWLTLRARLVTRAPFNPVIPPASARAPAPRPTPQVTPRRAGARSFGRQLAAHIWRLRYGDREEVDGRTVVEALTIALDDDEAEQLARLAEERLDGEVEPLIMLALLREFWIRPLGDWPGLDRPGPSSSSPRGIVSALAEHLLAERPAPQFLLGALFDSQAALEWLACWLLLARGGCVRSYLRERARHTNTFTPITPQLVPYLAKVPADLPLELGLAYAVVLSVGGTIVELRRVLQVRRFGLMPGDPRWRRFVVRAVRWLARHREAIRDDRQAALILIGARGRGWSFDWDRLTPTSAQAESFVNDRRMYWYLRPSYMPPLHLPASIAASVAGHRAAPSSTPHRTLRATPSAPGR